ncbi:L-rhamnose mutarotase [Nesterenkonia sandarakina]|uniref:L-rhamnose mutarotase n=1 Tax=Nesterenkonia sandarakina TaxID=272918 RepID=A0A2T0YN82_9MICC|nr:L-rhamnose mutarotase [Nesterenkonia sandarakina]PRZ16748.1 L-rhamnose mutarotase [Nesterenkonia sandarakina]
MQRVCFQLQVKPERLEEYAERHRAVWPEMLQALKRSGWHNYSLFLREDGLLIGYVEVESLTAAQAAMDAEDINAAWQEQMGEFFIDLDGARPDTGFLELQEVFHLEDQLAAVEQSTAQTPQNPQTQKHQTPLSHQNSSHHQTPQNHQTRQN